MIDYDFAFYLTLATFVTGVVWLLDKSVLEPRRMEGTAGQHQTEPWYVEYSKSFFPVLLFVLVLRSFLAEPFRIPSGSMLPTLEVGDFILVNKFAYGLRLPVLNTKVISIGEPQRGDVVVFRYPRDPGVDYIKRVIGLPGDTIAYRAKQLYINGEQVPLEQQGPYTRFTGHVGAPIVHIESLPGRMHEILLSNRQTGDFSTTVPPDHYFVMGDNRDDSADSRVWGFLPEENLVGKAFFVWMHYDFGGDGFALSRIGNSIE